MGSIFHIVKEERERLNEAQRAYQAAIARAVQGAPQVKRVGRKEYLYLARRNGSKVAYKYVGHLDDENSRKILDSVKQRREYQKLLKGVKSDLKEVKKALRGRKV
jgi:hypothetical protein